MLRTVENESAPRVNTWSQVGGESPPAVHVPGESPPRKKPKPSVTAALRRKLDDVEPKTGKPYAELVADRILIMAINGNFPALKEIWERTDGKVPDRIAGPDGGPVQIEALVSAIQKVYGQSAADDIVARYTTEGEQ